MLENRVLEFPEVLNALGSTLPRYTYARNHFKLHVCFFRCIAWSDHVHSLAIIDDDLSLENFAGLSSGLHAPMRGRRASGAGT